MPLDLARFVASYPRLYHLTQASNIEHITAAGRLRTSADFLIQSGRGQEVTQRRREHLIVDCGGARVHLRDQAPLHAGNLTLSDGWSFERFVEYLNRHVFFWPGSDAGPIDYGRRHFARYASEDVRVLVLKTAELFDAMRHTPPRFSRYNSGSPRYTGGRPSPRGPGTFLPAQDFGGVPSSVVEVVFPGEVVLPPGPLVVVSPTQFTTTVGA